MKEPKTTDYIAVLGGMKMKEPTDPSRFQVCYIFYVSLKNV